MAQITKEIRVDVSQPNVFQAIVAKQLDCNSRFLKITLVDFGVKIEVPNTAKVTINANRPDGKSDSFMGVANNDGTITVPLAQWMLEVAGLLKCDVSVINTTDNKKLTSTDFFVNVQEAANKNNTISENPDGEIRVITPVNLIDENSTDDQYPSAKAVFDLDNITATATGKVITINPANAPLPQLKLKGETTQEVAPNTNVLPYPFTSSTQTVKGVTFTDNGDGSITISGTNSLGSTDVTITSNAKLNNVVVGAKYRIQSGATSTLDSLTYQVRVVTPNSTQNLSDGDEFEADSTDVTVSIVFQITLGTTYDLTITPKIVVTECDLISVGDSGGYSVDLYGRNLCDPKSFNDFAYNGSANAFDITTYTITMIKNSVDSAGRYCLALVPFEIGKEYTLSFDIKGTAGRYVRCGFDSKSITFALTNQFERYSVTITAYKKDQYIIFYSNSAESGGLLAGEYMQFANVQIEAGTQATPYEPFNKQTLTNTDTLRGIGDIADERDYARGVKIQRFVKINARDFSWTVSAVSGGKYGITTSTVPSNIQKPLNDVTLPKVVCNICTEKTASQIWGLNEGITIWTNSRLMFYLADYNTSDITAWNNYIASNDVEIIYPLATPIETPLSETELNAYRHLMTNKGNTTILSEADMEVDYYINKPNAQAIGNIHSQVNKDYFKLQQAIISTGGN